MAKTGLARLWQNNSLTIVTVALFLIFLVGQSVAGHRNYNDEQQEHGQPEITYTEYLTNPEFVEATFENWESEFLQMGMFVLLTIFLFQKGSAESKEPGTSLPESRVTLSSPKILRRGDVLSTIYQYSLTIAMFALFIMSLFLHAAGGSGTACEEAMGHGTECYSTLGYMATSQFWFESFQNWQSEFLAVASLVFLSIFLRQKGSPESKSVGEPHSKTG